jgi:signal transduction histidine kinase
MLPVLAVVIVAILACSLVSAYVAADWTRERQEENLARVVATLTEASFPLNESVLRRMSGLSGAEFVVFDAEGHFQASSRPFSRPDLAELLDLPRDQKLADFASSKTIELSGRRYMANRLSVANAPAANGALMSLAVAYPEERWTIARRQAVYPPLVVGAVAILLAVLVTAVLARRFVRPLDALRRQAAAIEHGDFTPLPLSRRNDEIQDLAKSINHMAERLARYEADVRQNERLRTLGQLGAGIAHQMRNAATGARLALDLHRQSCPLEPGSEELEVATRQFLLMESYLQRFLTLGRRESAEHARVDLAALVDETLPLVRPNCNHARIDLQYARPAEPIWISGDPYAIVQMLINLLLNAVDAASALPLRVGEGLPAVSLSNGGEGNPARDSACNGLIRVSVNRDPTGRAICRISDSGPGPTPEIGGKLFEPFVSDKPDGAGLGLAVVRQIATEHNAELSWHRDGGLTHFVIAFPPMTST